MSVRDFIVAKDAGGDGDNRNSNHHYQQTDTQFFTGLISFLSPNLQCQRTDGEDFETLHVLITFNVVLKYVTNDEVDVLNRPCCWDLFDRFRWQC